MRSHPHTVRPCARVPNLGGGKNHRLPGTGTHSIHLLPRIGTTSGHGHFKLSTRGRAEENTEVEEEME